MLPKSVVSAAVPVDADVKSAALRQNFFITFVHAIFTTLFEGLFTNVFEVVLRNSTNACLYRACNAD